MTPLPADLAASLRELSRQVLTATRKSRGAFLDIGKLAATAQELLACFNEPGLFARWCKDSGLSQATAYRAIAVHCRFGDIRESRKQPTEALTILTKNDAAANEGRERIAKGDRLTIREAKKILTKHQPPKQLPAAPGPTTPTAHVTRSFNTSVGMVVVRVLDPNASNQDIGRALAEALRGLQAEHNDAEPPPRGRSSLFGRTAA